MGGKLGIAGDRVIENATVTDSLDKLCGPGSDDAEAPSTTSRSVYDIMLLSALHRSTPYQLGASCERLYL